jgi:ribonuclease T2
MNLKKCHFLLGLLVCLAACAGLLSSSRAEVALECVLDRCQADNAALPENRLRASVAPGDFDYYVLALSWSPGFCSVTNSAQDREQCGPGANFTFVVHGLWPQRERELIADCEAGLRPPSRADINASQDLFPTAGLARYEWRKHGGCTGLPASAYFAEVRRAREAVVVPSEFSMTRDMLRLSPEDVLRSFRAANPALRPGMASVACAKGTLLEVRVCMTKDLRGFTACPEVVSRSCRAQQIAVPPPL